TAALPLERFGWASVQLDGGIEKTVHKVEAWFAQALAAESGPVSTSADVGALTLGLHTAAPISPATVQAITALARAVVAAGGSVVLPATDSLLDPATRSLWQAGESPPHPSLAYGQPIEQPGLHVVATETEDWAENLAGLG